MHVTSFKDYNSQKAPLISLQFPLKTYHQRVKAVFVWKNLTLKQVIPHIFALVLTPLAYPLLSLPALAGRVALFVLEKRNPHLLIIAARVIQQARKACLTLRKPPLGTIRNGNGEFLVFRKVNGLCVALRIEEYTQVYACLNRTQFWTSLNYRLSSGEVLEQFKDEHAFILNTLKKLNPAYEMAFIPQSLYEMAYLNKCVDEDLAWCANKKNIYGITGPIDGLSLVYLNNLLAHGLRYHAPILNWTSYPTPETLLELENNMHIRELHRHLNNHLLSLIQLLGFDASSLNFKNLQTLADHQIALLAECAKGSTTVRGKKIAELWKSTSDYDHLTYTLHTDVSVGRDRNSLSFGSPKKQALVRKAIRLECSPHATQNAYFYRGADRKRDRPSGTLSNPRASNALSFGRSLFAGAVWDSGSCAFGFMHDAPDAMLVPIPKWKFHRKNAPMDVVPTSTIYQLIGYGDFFHTHFRIHPNDPLKHAQSQRTLRTLKYKTLFLN